MMKPGIRSDSARAAFLSKWRGEADTMRRRGVLVAGALLCEEFVRDAEALFEAEADTVLTLGEAAARSGYTADHLGRLVRQGRIPNAGRPHAPCVRLADLPRRVGTLPGAPAGPMLLRAGQVARTVVAEEARR